MKLFSLRLTRILFAPLFVSLLSPAVTAQTVDEGAGAAPSSALDIPEDVTLFANRDPNVRRATALVNGEVITQTDVEQRLALVVLANSGRVSDEEKDRLRLQVLRNLIDETLQIQEAAAKDIRISPAELDQNFDRVAQNFHYTPANFATYLASHGSSARSIKRQIEGEVAWSRLLQREVQPRINVSDDEVNAVIDRLKAAKGQDEYRIGEIYLSATPETSQQVMANGQQILEQIRQGGSFQAYARQYSEASTAAVGGDLGWVRLAQLPDALAQTAQEMQVGQVAGPIVVPGGYSILYVIDKRQVLTADPRDALLNLKQISIEFPAGTTPAQAQQKADAFGTAIQSLRGCGAVNDVAHSLGASVVENDGIRVRDLPPQLQNVLLQMQIGEATPPFGSVSDGVRSLILCGRDDPQDAGQPSFDQIMAQMEEDRVGKRARTYLRDLRRDAVIDYN